MTDRKIIDEEKKIEALEKKILKQEGRIETMLNDPDGRESHTLPGKGQVLTPLHSARHALIAKLSKHRFLFTLLIVFAVVLVWRGAWELTASVPILSASVVALVVGLLILWIVEKYADLN